MKDIPVIEPKEIIEEIYNLRTGEKYNNDEEWKAKGIPESEVRKDVRVIMPSLDLFGETKQNSTMAITRSQQARQMLKEAGFVVQDGFKNYIKNSESVTVPKEFKSREDATPTKLAYITKDEAKMLKKMKKGTPHKGPKGIPSYDDYDAATGSFRSGAAMSAAETGGKTTRDRRDTAAAGMSPQEVQDIRSSAIAAGAGQRVNPGFFDSKNVISPIELRLARQYANRPGNLFAKKAMRKTRGGGLLGFLTSGGILGNLIRGLGQGLGLGKKFNEPTYDMRQFSNLGLFEPSVNPTNLDIYNEFVDDEDDTNVLPKMILPKRKPDTQGLLEVPGIPITPFQRDVIEDTQDQDFTNFEDALMASAKTTKPLDYRIGISDKTTKSILDSGFNLDGTEMTPEEKMEYEKQKKEMGVTQRPTAFAADGGMIGGGIMDAAGRQQYFLGKLVKKATRAVKKIVKSPIGRLGLGALALKFGGGFDKGSPLMNFLFKKGTLGSGLTGKGMLALGGALSAAPFLFGQEEEEQPTGFTGSVGGQIDPRAYTDPYGVLYGAFKAEGGSMKDEPVAKRTMPLLDMGGQEMDLRAEGGFVPIGRMEKADDVPARLSKNEFVFTADAVRNAGDGDVDKGAEVMYNMMKNLEAGGEVSEESQGLEGARKMFQTSQRLEEVL